MSQSHPSTYTDLEAMQLALQQAQLAIGLTEPNPRVGCVILDRERRLIGQGHTQAAGQAHAEIMALRDAQAKGHSLRDATVFVTLEPCAHHGRTAPCCEALSPLGLARVVVAVGDPNPQVAGQGLAHLRSAGVTCEVGLLAAEASELNIGFLKRMRTGLPFVRMKMASSLDGRTALPDGTSQWITGAQARHDGHLWRRRAAAILTGIGTVKDDDPRLDVRGVEMAVQPLRVVVDSKRELAPHARILQAPGQVLWCHADASPADRHLEPAPEQLYLPNEQGKVDLLALLKALGARGVNEVHVEAGAKLNASLLQAGLVDELLLYLAPKLVGDGRGLASLGVLQSLDEALVWQWHEISAVGSDLRLRLRPSP